jgi:tripartite-type tricarboxylate transporter receptor subunit TctC
MKIDRKQFLMAAVAWGVCAGTANAQAQFPSRPVKIVVPFAPGGTSDTLARIIADGMSRQLSQPVVVDNKAGAAGTIGAEFVARAPADGYTLGFAHPSSHSVAPLVRKLNFDMAKDLVPVMNVGTCPTVWAVGANVPANTLTEFIALAKQNPGKYTFGSSGPGSSGHLKMELLQYRTGAQILHVPYRGMSFVIQDVLAGQVDSLSDDLPSSLPYIKAGKFKALAVSGPTRVPGLENVPTFGEQGLNDMRLLSWFGIVAPARTPPEVIAVLNAAGNSALADPKVREAIQKLNLTPAGGSAADFGAAMDSDRKTYEALLKAVPVKLE